VAECNNIYVQFNDTLIVVSLAWSQIEGWLCLPEWYRLVVLQLLSNIMDQLVTYSLTHSLTPLLHSHREPVIFPLRAVNISTKQTSFWRHLRSSFINALHHARSMLNIFFSLVSNLTEDTVNA